jgi:hypothetical protein
MFNVTDAEIANSSECGVPLFIRRLAIMFHGRRRSTGFDATVGQDEVGMERGDRGTMNRRSVIVEGPLAFRMRRIDAARQAEAGVQIMSLPQLAARLAGGFTRPARSEDLDPAIRSALEAGGFAELESIRNLPGMTQSVACGRWPRLVRLLRPASLARRRTRKGRTVPRSREFFVYKKNGPLASKKEKQVASLFYRRNIPSPGGWRSWVRSRMAGRARKYCRSDFASQSRPVARNHTALRQTPIAPRRPWVQRAPDRNWPSPWSFRKSADTRFARSKPPRTPAPGDAAHDDRG